MKDYSVLKEYLCTAYKRMFASPQGDFKFSALLPVSCYSYQLWDWGCWTSNIAIRQIMTDLNKTEEMVDNERGCVLNFLNTQKDDGSIEITIASNPDSDVCKMFKHRNVHKPVIAQHTAFILKYEKDISWIKEYDVFPKLEKFVAYYENNAKHESGLYYFFDDFAIGADNDPCTFYRPDDSSASIYLNTFMYKELLAMAYLAEKLGLDEKVKLYNAKAEELKNAINTHCYDEKDGSYYSVDIGLRKIDKNEPLHSGAPRHYSTLIQRIGFWSNFLPLWAGIPTEKQAERIVKENLLDEKGFWANYGVRTLSKYEKMYRIVASSNPSSWHGGIWGVSNYFVFKGLLKYGYKAEAEELAIKTLDMFQNDLIKNGAFHEYYDPETGEGVYNKDFLSWNLLSANMLAYFENRETVEEF